MKAKESRKDDVGSENDTSEEEDDYEFIAKLKLALSMTNLQNETKEKKER
jgi:hypothetical protein